MVLPPLSAQRAYLICYQALLLQDGGVRNVLLLPHHCGPAGSSNLHQTAGEVQRETQALHCVCVLLLRSHRGRREIKTPGCGSVVVNRKHSVSLFHLRHFSFNCCRRNTTHRILVCFSPPSASPPAARGPRRLQRRPCWL